MLWRGFGALCGFAFFWAAAAVSAADPFAHCEALFAAAPDRWESSRCFYDDGRAGGLLDEAAHRLEGLARRAAGRPWPRLALAYVMRERDVRHAGGWYRDAIAAFEARGDTEGEVRARCAFAGWLSGQGEHRKAGAQIAVAVHRAEAAGSRPLLAEALIFQARHLEASGTGLQEPYRLARQAESYLFPGGPAIPQMLCLELLAGLERELGESEKAGFHFRRLGQLAQANGRGSLAAKAQLGLGLLLFEELDRAPRDSGVPRAAAQLRRALAAAEAVGDPQAEALSHSAMAHLVTPAEAWTHIGRCLAFARDRDDSIATACLLTRARLQAETDPEAAERSLQDARAAAERSGDPTSLARFWYDRMNLHWRFGPREQAVADSEQAIRSVEDLRDRQLEQAGRAGLFSRWLAPYYAASGHLLAAYQQSGDPTDLDRAFAITDSLRGRVLRELLGGPRSSEPPPTPAAITAGLDPREALLSFQIAPRRDFFGFAGGSWLLVFTRRGARAYSLPETVDRAPLETTVSALLGLIERRDGGEGGLAETLRVQLLGQALADLPPGVDRLVILPDGALHRLPFAALRYRGAPLTDRYRISTAFSVTLWERWRRQPRREVRAALVLADPRLPEALARTAELRGDGSGRLPGARREGEHVLRTCGEGVLRAGSGAGEAFLKRQNLSRFGVLHLAAHAVADETNPQRSAVLLAADAPGEDGQLQVDEIARLDLRGSLVALSSCRSAGGALVGGEGVMSLSRAFFAAGSAAVIGNLWPVRDDDAEAFFEIFYDHLSAGETAATAFSAAQRERLRDGAPAQAWAGFVLAGNGEWRLPPAPPRPARSPLFFLVPAGFLALGFGSILIFRVGP
jgi:tetratricopeptide (TPR) repeat protein